MKTLLLTIGLVLVASTADAAGCVANARGETVCRGPNGAIVAPTAVVRAPAYRGAVSTQGLAGSTVGYNAHTGNAAVSHTSGNGVTTTETSRGGEAKTRNGMGVARGAGGTTCVKGRDEAKCN